MSRRDQIRMTGDELDAFLRASRTVTCATLGPNGRPHLVPLWFVPHDGAIACWTYRRSQKVANLRREPRATLQFEDGTDYAELRGATMECDAEVVDDASRTAAVGLALTARYALDGGSAAEVPAELVEFVRGQAEKRVALLFRPTRTVTWDHRKLGGTY
ncbi:Pyridoxamine 5'-phosphate oxidase [Actinomadura rubteroloni]|uniref:Pyridoxamine 5'-phosphate oxidase n=1 Tax=Actinomadura rubteroloni TaxID=1926885 RepID=A0A2P4UF32_9ACTN|nr:pyridoxamine 5'-phosphate oxidase family protein [Actinomadura rubteroloni]POM23663.1 Pyridoxamine 5'-phosphate oxidase [Actinomadura rubteroloni]